MGITGEAIATRNKSAAKETTKRQAQPEADPIFAAIERAKKKAAAYHNYGQRHGQHSYEVNDADEDAFWAVFGTAPTTRAGTLALLKHLFSPRWPDDGGTMLQYAFNAWGGECRYSIDYKPDESKHISEMRWTATMNAALDMLQAEAHS